MIADLDQPKVTFHQLNANLTSKEGDDVTLSCNATAFPKPTISWTRNGLLLNTTDNSRIDLISSTDDKKQLTITELTIRDVNRRDSGEYRCVGSNKLGNDTSNAVFLDVQCKNTVRFLVVYFIDKL